MGSRGGEYERGALILSRALVLLKVNWPEGPREGGLGHWFLSGHPERNSPPAGGEIPPAKRAIQRPDEGIGPYKKAFYRRPLIRLAFGQPPFPIPSGRRPSPLDKGSRPPRGKAFRGSAPSSGLFGATFPLGGRSGRTGGPVCCPYEKSGETLYIKL